MYHEQADFSDLVDYYEEAAQKVGLLNTKVLHLYPDVKDIGLPN